jgi:hypothetical protein
MELAFLFSAAGWLSYGEHAGRRAQTCPDRIVARAIAPPVDVR